MDVTFSGTDTCAPVFLTRCATYDTAPMQASLASMLDAMDALPSLTPGMTVGIKANLVSAMRPETAATTHPSLLCALVRWLKAKGAGRVIIGDSPGGLYTSAFVNHIYEVTGLTAAIEAGAELNQDFRQVAASFPEATVLKSFHYTAWLDTCDILINVCKLKSHGMMGMSAATKNMFGVIPGTMKPEYHFRFPQMSDFASMLVDINDAFVAKCQLCVVDAVEGMEGNGPTKGTPRHIGLLLASTSPHPLDAVCAHIIHLTPEEVPTLLAARAKGYIPDPITDIPLRLIHTDERGKPAEKDTSTVSTSQAGWPDVLQELVIHDFDNIAVRHSLLFDSKGKLVSTCLKGLLTSRPQLHAPECVGCGKCAQICPAHAITIQKKKSGRGIAAIDRSRCIRCFCCQEFCPTGAMKVHRTWIAKRLVK